MSYYPDRGRSPNLNTFDFGRPSRTSRSLSSRSRYGLGLGDETSAFSFSAESPPSRPSRSPTRHRSSSRRPSFSLTSSDAYLAPTLGLSDVTHSRSPSAGSGFGSVRHRYPPSASRSSALFDDDTAPTRTRRRSSFSLSGASDSSSYPALFPLELDLDMPRTSSRPGHRSGSSRSSSGSWQPTATSRTRRAQSPPRSMFFAGSTSSSSSSSPVPLGRQISGSSGGSSLFARNDGSESFTTESPTVARNARGHPQIHSTSYQSGFSSQMEIDAKGEEHFRDGTEISTRWKSYRKNKELANNAAGTYAKTASTFPRHSKVYTGPNAALGQDDGLSGNFTIPEHRQLRRLAHEAFQHKRAEVLGRESFNRDYATVWEKRKRQTGNDSPGDHEKTAVEGRRNANRWLNTRESHAEVMEKMGVPASDITPMSSWGSRGYAS